MISLPAAPPGCHWVPIVTRHVWHHVRHFHRRIVGTHHHHVAHHVARRAAVPAWRLVCRGVVLGGGAAVMPPAVALAPPVAPYAAPAPQLAGGGWPGYLSTWPGGPGWFGGGSGGPVTWPNIVGGIFTPGTLGLPTVPITTEHKAWPAPSLIETPTVLFQPPPVRVTENVPPIGPRSVPEPATIAVMLSGLGMLGLVRGAARAKR